jgi:glutathione peroxidase
MNAATSIYEFECSAPDGTQRALDEYRGKVLLIVNTASKCGLTPQFEALEALYKDLAERGLVILGFPCNQFAGQDPGNNDEILSFCQRNYGVSFPMFGKIEVNGDGADPLFKFLKQAAPGAMGSKAIKWNFTKFLVDAKGSVVRRYAPTSKPEDIRKDIEALLA